MKVYEKMNELKNTNSSKRDLEIWAYMNRVYVCDVDNNDGFSELKDTVDKFIEDVNYYGIEDESDAWELFLDFDVVEG